MQGKQCHRSELSPVSEGQLTSLPLLPEHCSFTAIAPLEVVCTSHFVLCSYERRLKESLDRERAWMADKPDWVTNKSVYFTKKQDRTVNNPLDTRSMDRIDPNN